MLHGPLSKQKNKFATLKEHLIPPVHPHYGIYWGELNISSGISASNLHVQPRFGVKKIQGPPLAPVGPQFLRFKKMKIV